MHKLDDVNLVQTNTNVFLFRQEQATLRLNYIGYFVKRKEMKVLNEDIELQAFYGVFVFI